MIIRLPKNFEHFTVIRLGIHLYKGQNERKQIDFKGYANLTEQFSPDLYLSFLSIVRFTFFSLKKI